jgi:hypothetical protein
LLQLLPDSWTTVVTPATSTTDFFFFLSLPPLLCLILLGAYTDFLSGGLSMMMIMEG